MSSPRIVPVIVALLLVSIAPGQATAPGQVTVPGQATTRLELVAPRGMPDPVPGSATFHADIAALGRSLFFDSRLSIDRQIACANCHRPDHGFSSVEALPPGSLGKRALRHAPTLINRAYGTAFSWDGKAKTLEEQVILPISNPNEMALPLADAVRRLRADKIYGARFETLFGRPATAPDLSLALASYVRTLTQGNTVIDKFQAAAGNELTREERAGLWIYESKGGCWKCHSGPNFSDEGFHNTGVGVEGGMPRLGRRGVTLRGEDAGKFKTPTLRGLVHTAPYMHDGSMKTLAEVVAFYRRGGNRNPLLDARLSPLSLSEKDASNLLAFLRALSRPADQKSAGGAGLSNKGRKRGSGPVRK